MLKGVNWIAVIVAVVLVEALGFLWYGMVFEAAWTAGLGREVTENNLFMALGAVNSLVVVLGLSWLNRRTGAGSLTESVTNAVVAWLCFAATTTALQYLYMGFSLEFTLINAGYLLAAFVVAGAALALVKFGRSARAAAA